MKHLLSMVVYGALGVAFSNLALASPTLNYQGRVTAEGNNFTGDGYFKFVLHNGSDGMWSNDGSTGIGEPGSSETIEVNNGLFNVELGEGMEEISPLVFHEDEVYLRTWFSTNNTTFEQLSPDVRIRPMDLAHIDTGDMIVVDNDGNADFDNIQDAINYATNDGVRGVLIMPGHYNLSAPLTVPEGDWYISIRGLDRNWTHIENTVAGPTLRSFDGVVSDLTLAGSPAIEGNTGHYPMYLRDCTIVGQQGASPAVLLADGSFVWAHDCEFRHEAGGTTVYLTEESSFYAERCQLDVHGGAGNVLEMNDFLGYCDMDGSSVHSEGDAALYVTGEMRHSRFERTSFWGPIEIDGGKTGSLDFVRCNIDNLRVNNVMDCGLSLTDCDVDADWGPPALALSPSGDLWIDLKNCKVEARTNHVCSLSGGHIEFNAKGCVFEVREDNGFGTGNGFNLNEFEGQLNIADSHIEVVDGRALAVSNGIDWSQGEFARTHFDNGIQIENTVFGCSFTDCHIEGGLFHENDAWYDFRGCTIQGHEGEHAVSIYGGSSPSFTDCDLESSGDTTLYVEDLQRHFTLQSCKLRANEATVVELVATTAIPMTNFIGITFVSCELSTWVPFGSEDLYDSIIFDNDPANEGREIWAALGLIDSYLQGWYVQDGIRCSNADLMLRNTRMEAGRYGVCGTNSEIEVESGTTIDAGNHGILGHNCDIGVKNSVVSGGSDKWWATESGLGDGICATGQYAEIVILHSVVEGEEDDGTGPDGKGLYIAADESESYVVSSVLGGSGPGLDCEGGVHTLTDSFIHGEGTATFLRNESTTGRFDRCTFVSMWTNTTDNVIVLHGDGGGTAAPTPEIINCSIRSDSVNAVNSIGIAGGVASASAVLMNSAMTHDKSGTVSLVAPASTLSYGNYVLP